MRVPAPQRLWRAIFEAIAPLPSLSPSQWANLHRRLSPESSAQPGKFVSLPYQDEPLNSVADDDVSETILWWASQLGKSELVNNVIGYHMDEDPGSQLLVQPTQDLGEAYSKERIAPMIRDTPRLKAKVRDPRSRDSGNTITFKRYPGGSLALTGANAPGGLAGRPRRVVLQDEVDRFPASAGTEGDPCALADKRAESFPNAVKLKTSTATIKGLSKIEKLFEGSDKQKWHVKCRKCDHEHVLLWDQVKWDEGKPDTAWIECPNCREALSDEDRVAMVRAGKWIATAPFKGTRGYWLNGLNILFKCHKGYKNRLHQFVAEFLKAKDGGAQTMKVWINTFLAETFEEDASKIDAGALAEHGEEYTPDALPAAVLIVTAAVDVQRNRLELEFKGWAPDEESFGIQKVVLNGDTERDHVWKMADEQLRRQFKREDGVELRIARVFVDMGFRSHRVLAFCASRVHRGVYPCRGINRVGINIPPLLPAKPSRNNKMRIPHWNVGVTAAKTAIHDRVDIPIPGPRSMHFAGEALGYDGDYFAQLASERRFLKYSRGQPYYVFEKESESAPNEALDLNVYNLGALHSLFPIAWEKLAANMKKTKARKPAKKVEDAEEGKSPAEESAESGQKEESTSEDTPRESKPPLPINYTEMMTSKNRPRKFRRSGFVKGW